MPIIVDFLLGYDPLGSYIIIYQLRYDRHSYLTDVLHSSLNDNASDGMFIS